MRLLCIVIPLFLSIPTSATIVDLQQFRQDQTLSNSQGDVVRLTNLNPRVGAWYVLDLNIRNQRNTLHIEVPTPVDAEQAGPGLLLYSDGLVVPLPNGELCLCALWAGEKVAVEKIANLFVTPPALYQKLSPQPELSAPLRPGYTFTAPYTQLADGLLLVRSQFKGQTNMLEAATDTLRHTGVGDWFVEKVKPYLLDPPEAGEHSAGDPDDKTAPDDGYPKHARVDPTKATLYSLQNRLGIETEAPEKKLYYGRWYKAVRHEGVFVSLIMASVVEKAIFETFKDRVNPIGSSDKAKSEAEALVYLLAFDLDRFRFGYALGSDHPGVEWSDQAVNVKRTSTEGPDGIRTKTPLATIGAVPPYYVPWVAATFVGGFKRKHGAFKWGEFAGVNNGSHFGFMEQGSLFSTLQPGLATAAIALDGSIELLAWPKDGAERLAGLRAARQNCPPIIESYNEPENIAVPGRYVNNHGAGAWSGNQDGSLLTIRSGIGIQERPGSAFLIFAYFTGATPNAMARVFQAYGCRFAMLLDMNTPNYGYAALYLRDATDSISGAEYLNSEMARGNGPKDALKFVQTNDNRDFFYVLRKP